jgi:hypothetical protein
VDEAVPAPGQNKKRDRLKLNRPRSLSPLNLTQTMDPLSQLSKASGLLMDPARLPLAPSGVYQQPCLFAL